MTRNGAAAPPEEEVVGWIGERPEATTAMPLVGEVVAMAGERWRCVAVNYADEEDTKGQPELRVRYRRLR